MTSYIKFLWDFRGSNGYKTAMHHRIHLEEYIKSAHLTLKETGVNKISEHHSIAYMHILEEELNDVKNALKPHRGERVTL